MTSPCLMLLAPLCLVSACGGSMVVEDGGTLDSGSDAGTGIDAGTDAGRPDSGPPVDGGPVTHHIRKVFVIVEENHEWSSIAGSSSAPYLNSLLATATVPAGWHVAFTNRYYNPPRLHPSEPNYIWMEAGDNLGLTGDGDPDPTSNHSTTTDHLVSQLETAGLDWGSYQEDIDDSVCPLTAVLDYAPKHNPMVFFDDVTDGISATSAHCIAHVHPYTQLAIDMGSVDGAPDYNFITPNLCHDMHGAGDCGAGNNVLRGDNWLRDNLPAIVDYSNANDGVVFVTWDEGALSDGPIGMIVISPYAKDGQFDLPGAHYTHASLLRSVEEIFGVPLLRAAADPATADLRDLFMTFP